MHLIFSSDPPQTSMLKSFSDQVIWLKSCNFVRQWRKKTSQPEIICETSFFFQKTTPSSNPNVLRIVHCIIFIFYPTHTVYTISLIKTCHLHFETFAYLANWQSGVLNREDSKAGVLLSPQMQEMALHHHQQQHHHQHPDGAHYDPARNHTLINNSPPILPNPMSALSQLNPQVSRSAVPHGSPSPPGSKSATPSPSSSNQEEETDPHLKVLVWLLWHVVVAIKAWQCLYQVVNM